MLSAVTPVLVQFIPSPDHGVWHLGPVPIRGYALSIILGIVAAIWIGEKRWVARGGRAGEVSDVAIWAVPFGVIGGRIYHVITDNHLYFGSGANIEIGLTGSKIHAVAFAALAAAGRIAAAWYVSPKRFDMQRFTTGVAETRCFDLSLDADLPS